MLSLHDRIAGGIWGLLVGDAVGVPYEFHPPGRIPPRENIDMQPPPGFARAHAATPLGTWSDDGAQALILLASLLECGRFDAHDFGSRLVNWLEKGYLAVDNRIFDCGIQSAKAIRAIASGTAAHSAGSAEEMSNGNGALMRALPLALWHQGSDADLVRDAQDQSRVTHGHLRSQVCCAVYCLWARRILFVHPEPWRSAVETFAELYGRSSPEWIEFEQHVKPDRNPTGKGTGYVVDTLQSVRQVLAAETGFEGVVKASIALGHDTDTTACVAAGVAGIREGVAGIPSRWLNALRGRELVDPLLSKLLGRHSDNAILHDVAAKNIK